VAADAEEGHDLVADELVDGAAVALETVVGRGLDPAITASTILGVAPR
jgi:hypothetical protein